MKNLLVAVGDGPDDALLETALLVGRRFASSITGINSVSAEHVDALALAPAFSIHADFDRPTRRKDPERRSPQVYFTEFITRHGLLLGASRQGHERPAASWFEHDPSRKLSVGMVGRVYDLIIIRQPHSFSSLSGAALLDALFESGRPLLIVPRGSPQASGDIIGIAWNGSTETAQTVALAMPFLKQAKRVVVIAVGNRDMPEPGPQGEELAQMLTQEGMAVSLRLAAGRQKRQGEAFLREARAAGVDLLLKGAYTRNRLRQAVFGGSTRHIILESTIPVLMAR